MRAQCAPSHTSLGMPILISQAFVEQFLRRSPADEKSFVRISAIISGNSKMLAGSVPALTHPGSAGDFDGGPVTVHCGSKSSPASQRIGRQRSGHRAAQSLHLRIPADPERDIPVSQPFGASRTDGPSWVVDRRPAGCRSDPLDRGV